MELEDLTNFETYYKVTVTKIVGIGEKINVMIIGTKQNPEIDPYVVDQVEKKSFQLMVLNQLNLCVEKNENQPYLTPQAKINSMVIDIKCAISKYKIFRKYHRDLGAGSSQNIDIMNQRQNKKLIISTS